MHLSGGVYDQYRTELVRKKSVESDQGDAATAIPNADELFAILSVALANKNMCGCTIEDVIEKRTTLK